MHNTFNPIMHSPPHLPAQQARSQHTSGNPAEHDHDYRSQHCGCADKSAAI